MSIRRSHDSKPPAVRPVLSVPGSSVAVGQQGRRDVGRGGPMSLPPGQRARDGVKPVVGAAHAPLAEAQGCSAAWILRVSC